MDGQTLKEKGNGIKSVSKGLCEQVGTYPSGTCLLFLGLIMSLLDRIREGFAGKKLY